MKKQIFIFLLIVFSSSICFAQEAEFIDVGNHWAKNEIEIMAQNMIVSGYEDNTFRPDKEVSIIEFLKMLISNNKYRLSIGTSMDWVEIYKNTALSRNLILNNKVEELLEPLTRARACIILSRYINLDGVKNAKNEFKDLSKENKDIILKLVNLGVVNGFKDSTFRENEIVTRAQACKIILKAYEVKNELNYLRKYLPSHNNTNIGPAESGDVIIQNRYEIKNNRIYINDTGRYGKFSNLTLNQEYVNDELVISLIKSLVDDDSYTELIYVPDKNIINCLNVCYGIREDYVNSGSYVFQVRFFENARYNAKEATGIDDFCEDASIRIELDKMWEHLSEYHQELKASKKDWAKLEKALKALFGEKTSKDLSKYLEEKMVEASNIPNDDEIKIAEVEKFGKYTFNIFCNRDEKIIIYVKSFK